MNAPTLIVGLGGGGGYTTEALVRSGIKDLILIDHDVIDKTNINRQIISNTNNIGNNKTEDFNFLMNQLRKRFMVNSFIRKQLVNVF